MSSVHMEERGKDMLCMVNKIENWNIITYPLKEVNELVKLDMIEGLSEDVSRHIIGSTMIEDNSAIVISLVDVVLVNYDVFSSQLESCILDELNSWLVVAVECDGIFEYERRVEFW